ncbi:MAG: ribonuclease III [Lentisphaerae bacterium]|nr:ribonuclease III [Lentisphaerota bacterium]MBQ4329844.1 ribonuclease III [Lentisphaeria bacterium]
MSEENIPRLARKLGIPKDKIPVLREALTHRTYAVEHHLAYDNQRLEFLGDAVLEIVHTEALYRRYPELPEGDLTKIRSALSCENTLAQIARGLELGSYLLIGNGEKECAGYDRDSTLCDLFEAVLGALYLSCGMEKTTAFIHKLFAVHCPEPKELLMTLNPKGRLQEFTQGKWHQTPEYRLFNHSGPQHAPLFEVEVKAANYCTIGAGTSRKLAETDAAAKMLKFFMKKFKA